MHEVARAREIHRAARLRARNLGNLPLKLVRVRIAAWAGIDADHLKHDFEAEFPGTTLEVEVVSPWCKCKVCGAEFDPNTFMTRCSRCGSARVTLDQSAECEIVDVEV